MAAPIGESPSRLEWEAARYARCQELLALEDPELIRQLPDSERPRDEDGLVLTSLRHDGELRSSSRRNWDLARQQVAIRVLDIEIGPYGGRARTGRTTTPPQHVCECCSRGCHRRYTHCYTCRDNKCDRCRVVKPRARVLTQGESNWIVELYQQGVPLAKIAVGMQRCSKATVRAELVRRGVRIHQGRRPKGNIGSRDTTTNVIPSGLVNPAPLPASDSALSSAKQEEQPGLREAVASVVTSPDVMEMLLAELGLNPRACCCCGAARSTGAKAVGVCRTCYEYRCQERRAVEMMRQGEERDTILFHLGITARYLDRALARTPDFEPCPNARELVDA